MDSEREVWLEEVGLLTKAHRARRADSYDRRADEIFSETLSAAREACEYAVASQPSDSPFFDRAAALAQAESKARDQTKWHRSRAQGQRKRIESVRSCARDGVMQIGCSGCGDTRFVMRTCSSSFLCAPCRSRKNWRTRKRFLRSRAVARGLARRAGVLFGPARWTEKLLTLTVPHLELGAPVAAERRFCLLKAAWKRLLRDLNREVFRPAARAKAHWYNSHEWTPGADELGHPHVHVWLLCPFLPRAWLIERWRLALAREGFQWRDGEQPIVDIRMAKGDRNGRGDDSIASELIKYLTKDLVQTRGKDGVNRLVDPAIYARMYELYDGSRRHQGSDGFIALADENTRLAECDCGQCGGFEIRFVRQEDSDYEAALAHAQAAVAERKARRTQTPAAAA